MNCENFNNRLPEYLEDTLSTAERDAARGHFQKCGACQQALARQEAFAKSIRLSFSRETQRLSLHPETKRNILSVLNRAEFPPTAWENIQTFFVTLWRHSAWVGTILVCLVLLIFGNRLYLGSVKHPPAQATVKEDRITCVIDVPMQTKMHVYRRQNNMVVDAVVTEISVIDASFSENTRSSSSSHSHIN